MSQPPPTLRQLRPSHNAAAAPFQTLQTNGLEILIDTRINFRGRRGSHSTTCRIVSSGVPPGRAHAPPTVQRITPRRTRPMGGELFALSRGLFRADIWAGLPSRLRSGSGCYLSRHLARPKSRHAARLAHPTKYFWLQIAMKNSALMRNEPCEQPGESAIFDCRLPPISRTPHLISNANRQLKSAILWASSNPQPTSY